MALFVFPFKLLDFMKMNIFGALALVFGTFASASNFSPSEIVQAFVDGLLHERSNVRFGQNKSGEFSLLSKRLQILASTVECDANRANREEDAPRLWANAAMVFDRWDRPTSCSVVNAVISPENARVEVDCSWDGTTDHASGQHIQIFFLLIQENGTWVTDNVQHGMQTDNLSKSDVTNKERDLISRLEMATHQSLHPEVCRKDRSVLEK